MKSHALFPRGDDNETAKYTDGILFFFSGTTWPISIKLGTKHPWLKGTKFLSNAGPRLFSKRGDREIVTIHRQHLKKILLKILFKKKNSSPESNNLNIKHSSVSDIK